MSISSEILRLQSAKSTLKAKLNAKNDEQHQIVNETIDEYGDFVDSISSGTDTSDATASASDILTGKTAYISTGKTNGSMVNNGVLSYIPSTSSQSIPTGYTLGGTIGAVTSSIDNNIIPENIKSGVTILGVTGTYGNESYTELEYIQSTGTQYIDTNIELTDTDILSIEMGDCDTTNDGCIFQANGNRWEVGTYLLIHYDHSGNLYWCCGGNIGVPMPQASKYTITVQGTGVKVNNTVIRSPGRYSGTVSRLGLMRCQNNFGKYKLYGIKIYDSNNILNHDIIPVNHAVYGNCIYDKITKAFYYNSGTGDFIAGSVVN